MLQLKRRTEEKVQKYLTEANRLLTEDLKNEKTQQFEQYCMILANTIKDGEAYANILRVQIWKVLSESKPSDTVTFLKELNALHKKEQTKKTYYFVATSNLDIKSITRMNLN